MQAKVTNSLVVALDPDNDPAVLDLGSLEEAYRVMDAYKVYRTIEHSQGVDTWLLPDGEIRIEQRV